jgi:hypothetical protein
MTSVHHGFGADNLIRNKAMARSAGDPLPRLLDQLLVRAGSAAIIERASSRPWASALFEGRRHVIRLRLNGPDQDGRLAAFIDGIGSAEWTLAGHFVADISIDDHGADNGGAWIDLSALTIEDW